MPTQRDSLIDCCYQLIGKLNSSFWPPSNVISIEQHEKWLESRHQFWVESSTSYPFDTSVNPQLIKSVKKTGKRSQFWVLKTKSALRKAVLRFSDSVHAAGAATATHWVNCNTREGSCERGTVGTLLENPASWRNGLGEAEGKGGSVTCYVPHILFDKWCPREGKFRKEGPESKSSGSEAYMKVGEK